MSSWVSILFAAHLAVSAQPVEQSWEMLKQRADDAFAEARWSEARDHYQQALHSAKREHASLPEQADLYNQLGRSLYEQGDQHDAARKMYQRGLDLHQRGGSAESTDAGAMWFNLGHVLAEQAQLEEAEDAYQRCAGIERAALGSDSLELAVTLAQLGNFHASNKAYARADPHFAEAASIRRKHSDSRTATTLKDWAINRYRLEDYPRAISLANEAIALADDDGEVRGLAFNVIAMSHEAQGDYPEAAANYRYALRLLRDALGFQDEQFQSVAGNYADLAIDHDPAWAAEAAE